QDDTEVEPYVAVDPNDPSVVVAVFQKGRFPDGGSATIGFSTSHDGGATWTAGDLPGLTVALGGMFQRSSHPGVAIGPDGAVYAQSTATDTPPFATSGCRTGIAIHRSDDGGLSFGAPVLVVDDPTCAKFNDKDWLAIDTFSGSAHFGRLYSVWEQVNTA